MYVEAAIMSQCVHVAAADDDNAGGQKELRRSLSAISLQESSGEQVCSSV